MAYLDTFLNRVVSDLQSHGISAMVEYPNQPLEAPSEWQRLMVSIVETKYEPALCFRGGSAFPVSLKLRLRLMQRPQRNVRSLQSIFQVFILPTLLHGGYDVRQLTLETPYLDRTLGRMVAKAECTLTGYVERTPTATLSTGGENHGDP